ncbi:MAG: hypothetical protein KKB29_01280, partial [Nanoarchaeota archaeon]|nr:hypothetical protein [Nanoarchaeota archaeon]
PAQSLFSWSLLVGIIILETILFWLFSNTTFKIKVGILKSLLVVAVANFITSVLGYLVLFDAAPKYIFFMALAGSILIEWGAYSLLFLKSKGIKTKLLYISLIVNAVSYLLIYLFFL